MPSLSYASFRKFKQLGLPEPWFVITHTIWTTQEDTVFISDRDRNGGRCSVSRADVSRDPLIVSESQKEFFSGFHSFWLSFFLAFTDDEGVPRNVCSTNWTSTTVPVSITNKNCVLFCRSNRVCYHESGVLVILIVWPPYYNREWPREQREFQPEERCLVRQLNPRDTIEGPTCNSDSA